MANKSMSVHPVLDLEGTMNRLAGDEELFIDLVSYFFEDAPQLLVKLKTAINGKDGTEIRSSAHALKGLIAGCGGVRATQAAQIIETAAGEGDLSNIDKQFELFAAEFDILTQMLSRYHS